MSVEIVGVMLGTSILIGLLGLIAFLWGLNSGQFDDEKKMMEGVLFDGEEELNEMADAEKRSKTARK